MTLTQPRVFIAVVEAGGFTAAAQQLYMIQSAVSQTVADLERELGVCLLERQRMGIVLIQVAKQILLRARIILDQMECIQQDVATVMDKDRRIS